MHSRNKKLIFNSIIIIFAIIIPLICGELLVRIISPQNLSGSWREYNQDGLLLNKNHGQSRHRLNDRDVTYSFGKYFNRVTTLTDDNAERILILGDSFTFGWLLRDEDSYINLLQKRYPNTHIINSAAGGWGAADYTRFVETYCKIIHPRKVIVLVNFDDIGRAIRSNLYQLDNDGHLASVHQRHSIAKQILNSIPGYQFLLEHSHLVQLIRKLFLIQNNVLSVNKTLEPSSAAGERVFEAWSKEDMEKSLPLARSLFLLLAKSSKACGAEPIIIYLGWVKPNDENVKLDPTMKFIKAADSFFHENNITFYDLTSEFDEIRGNNGDYVIKDDLHPNESGAAKIAKALDGLVSKNNILNKQ